MVSAPTSDVSPFQTAHKTQQLMRSTIRQLVADYTVQQIEKNYFYPLNKRSDFSKYEYVEFNL
jgi:hypothetical protein